MDRRDLFETIAVVTPIQHQALNSHVKDIGRAIDNIDEAFSIPDKYNEPQFMYEAMLDVVKNCISAMRDLGAVRREFNKVVGNSDGMIFDVVDEERHFQDTIMEERYGLEPRVLNILEEGALLRTYFRNGVKKALEAHSQTEAMNGIRKITAIALRGCENNQPK